MTYEYQCRSCGHQWEAEQRITEAPQTQCPSCEKETAMRLISKTSFILEGKNWESKDGY
jgi:putative FmdB family regulatory protein